MRVTVILGVALTCVIVARPALAKGSGSPVQASLMEASRVLPPYVSATYTARCPSSHPHPVGGEFDASTVAGVGTLTLAASYPQGNRGWSVVVQNLTGQPQGYLAGIICLRATAKFAYPRSTYVVEPQRNNASIVNCPAAAPHALSAYFKAQSPSDLGKSLLDSFLTVPGGKHESGIAEVKNFSGAPIGMYGGSVCTSLHTSAYGYDSTVAPGMHEVQLSNCPHKTPVAVGGYAYAKAPSDAASLLVVDMGNFGRRAYAGVRNFSDHPLPYSAGALCVG